MGPEWLESPQHFLGGALLAAAILVTALLRGLRAWLAVALAIGGVSAVEILIELAEYPWLYPNGGTEAYFDTVADLAATLVGALAGAMAGLLTIRAWRARRQPAPE